MIGSQPAVSPPHPSTSPPADARAGRRVGDWLGSSLAPVILGCFVFALISVIVLSWVPSSDPWAWIDWGQEIASSKLSVGLAGGPSWKPFPAVFTSVFGLFGSAAPHLWLLVSRTAGLLAFVAAFRLGRRFAGPIAGIVAVIALCFVQDWLFYLARGASEPIVAALTLWAIDRHLSGSPRLAYFLAFLATLNRPEFTPFLALYGAYLWLRVPGSRPLAVTLLVLVPIAWLVPPWLISGNAFQAGSAALGGKGSPGGALPELRSSVPLMGVPTLVLAAVGLGFAYVRRERTLLWLGAGAIVWALMVAFITQVGYGLPRYLLPAGTVACVLAGVGFVRIAEFADQKLGRPRPHGAGWVAFAVGAAVIAATLPWSIPRVNSLVNQGSDANQAAKLQGRLFTAVDRVGGRSEILPCGSSHVAVNHTMASALAWKLQTRLSRVRPLMRGTGYVFSAPHLRSTGTSPPIVRSPQRSVTRVAVVAPWTVRLVRHAGATGPPRCARRPRVTA
ncbi:MAG: hypothetical protein JO179_14385 [Solirubrobacterales bacterium]|nr:hypothetical protein [Solirubrobacterales bacterium]